MIELKLERYKKVLPADLQCEHQWMSLRGYEWCMRCGGLVSGDKILIADDSLPDRAKFDGKKIVYGKD